MNFLCDNEITQTDYYRNKFANDQLVNLFSSIIDEAEDYDGFEWKYYFPHDLFMKDKNYCIRNFYALKELLESYIIYDRVKPLYCYILYKVLIERIEVCEDNGDERYFHVPDDLRRIIFNDEELIKLCQCDEEADMQDYIDELEIISRYIENCLWDFDFLEDSVRRLVEAAVDGTLDTLGYDLNDLNEFIEIMPLDTAQRYEEFKKSICNQINIENLIVNSIESSMVSFERTVIDFFNKKETEITRDIQRYIENMLSASNIHITREFTMGRAKKKIGETDMYFYIMTNNGTRDIAVLENKNIESFKKQYFQLLGYLNPNFKFGITISINRNKTHSKAIDFILKSLSSIEGDFKVIKKDYIENTHYVISEHIVPETNKSMKVYHFILNLNDNIRKMVANEARR